MRFSEIIRKPLPFTLALVLIQPVLAQDAGNTPENAAGVLLSTPAYSPYANRDYPSRPLFGDTHLHTVNSLDAGPIGTRLGPRDSYRFARGEQINSNTGQPVKLSRPLDFLVVADHSDGMGFFPLLVNGDPTVMSDPQGRNWNKMLHDDKGMEVALDMIKNFGQGTLNNLPVPGTRPYAKVWEDNIAAADEYNEPGRFTSLIGFEWTSGTNGNNLHRNVVFRDGGDRAGQVVPFTTQKPLGSDNPADLWNWMAAYKEKTGGNVLAITHNGNLSGGLMFPTVEAFGKKIDRQYAQERIRWERLYEVTQTKGTSEAHPFLSPNDELADFEIWDAGNLDLSAKHESSWYEHEYARAAYKNGLKLEKKLGVNPYKFGMAGGTDAHTGIPTTKIGRAHV